MQTNECTDGVTDQRERARAMLDRIADRARHALADARIDLDMFFLIPNSGDAVLTFGTTSTPDDRLWRYVDEIVCSIVRETVGLRRTRSRPVVCASTYAVASSPVEMPVSIPAPLPAFDAGTDQP